MVDKMSRYRYAPLLVFQIFLMILYILFTTYGGAEEANIKGKLFFVCFGSYDKERRSRSYWGSRMFNNGIVAEVKITALREIIDPIYKFILTNNFSIEKFALPRGVIE